MVHESGRIGTSVGDVNAKSGVSSPIERAYLLGLKISWDSFTARSLTKANSDERASGKIAKNDVKLPVS